MYNIGICDDGENICASIEEMILTYSRKRNIMVDIKIWYTGEGLCNYLQQENYLDILFLDIELFHMSGIEVGKYIRNHLEDRGMQIIYISGKSSYAQKLFKTQPLDFLVKPVTQLNIDETLELAFKILRKKAEKFKFQYGKEYYSIPFGDIMFLFSEGRKIKIKTQKGEKEFYGKLKIIAKELPEEFIMIHQSYVINKCYILRYTYELIELTDGTILTISKKYRKQIREMILQEG